MWFGQVCRLFSDPEIYMLVLFLARTNCFCDRFSCTYFREYRFVRFLISTGKNLGLWTDDDFCVLRFLWCREHLAY